MRRFAVLLLLAVPAIAGADVWRWSDSSGRIHYSNVPGAVPRHAKPVRTPLGYVAGELEAAPPADEERPAVSYETLRRERAIQRRLADIEAFYAMIRERQRARLEAFSDATLLSDWMIADRWMQMKEEEQKLRYELARLKGDRRS